MKIGLIRHFPVELPFLRGLVSQEEVLQWFQSYNEAEIIPLQVILDGSWESCYSSELKRAKLTASIIYRGEINYSTLLNEPTPEPILKTNIRLPFVLWALIYRIALLKNHKSQSQSKNVIAANLEAKLLEILQNQKDTLIVGHVFTIEIISSLLQKYGFVGKINSRPKHGVLYVFKKSSNPET